ncbi:MAG: HTTM domain-containing protein [Mycobacteriales bacterium]
MIAAFRRWAFDPVDTAPMAALRIACGLLVLGWTLSLLPDAQAFLADGGLTPHAVDGTRGWWTVPLLSPYGVLAVLGLAAVALVIGWRTRVASVVVALLLVVVQRRDVYVLNSGDLLLRELALLVALMPAGETWSLDARRRPAQLRAPWGLRLLQLQVSAVYLFSVMAKLHGTSWQDGSAVGKALQLEDLQRLVVPHALATSVTVSALLTYGTLVVEAALVVGLWLPRTRWWVMAAGAAVHLGIEGTLLIGWFSLTVLSCYLAFVPAETLRRLVPRPRQDRVRLPAQRGAQERAPV